MDHRDHQNAVGQLDPGVVGMDRKDDVAVFFVPYIADPEVHFGSFTKFNQAVAAGDDGRIDK